MWRQIETVARLQCDALVGRLKQDRTAAAIKHLVVAVLVLGVSITRAVRPPARAQTLIAHLLIERVFGRWLPLRPARNGGAGHWAQLAARLEIAVVRRPIIRQSANPFVQ